MTNWTDEEIDKALLFAAAAREYGYRGIVTCLSERFQLSREEALELYRAARPVRPKNGN